MSQIISRTICWGQEHLEQEESQVQTKVPLGFNTKTKNISGTKKSAFSGLFKTPKGKSPHMQPLDGLIQLKQLKWWEVCEEYWIVIG